MLLESSDEEDGGRAPEDDESDTGGVVRLGRKEVKHVLDDVEPEIDLDEDNFADLDAQAAAYAQEHEDDEGVPEGDRTRRIAVVNLDWDHVKAIHLYKIFSSLVSPTAPALPSEPAASSSKNPDKKAKGGASRVARGKVLSVRVYPSEFGKERMAREEREGPPQEVFKAGEDGTGDAEDYNEEALRKYQLERLRYVASPRLSVLAYIQCDRYYYAIVECDTVEAASHIYNELEGTELERSANVFDLSFVPDDMTFDDEFRYVQAERKLFHRPDILVQGRSYGRHQRPVQAPRIHHGRKHPFSHRPPEHPPTNRAPQALRHSKVKLTWDEDDPERNQLTRRALTRKEIEENDFRAYLASSGESSEDEPNAPAGAGTGKGKGKGAAERERLRALLLGGGGDALPEGWGAGAGADGSDGDVDMEITFTPGLSTRRGAEEETTIERYARKMREKKKKRKEERKETEKGKDTAGKKGGLDDEFFGEDSDESAAEEDEKAAEAARPAKGKKGKKPARAASPASPAAAEKAKSTAEELALVAIADNPAAEPQHFDMKAVLKAEKARGKKRRGKKGTHAQEEEQEEPELQKDFAIDVADERFKAVHEDHTFAIDPSNPQCVHALSVRVDVLADGFCVASRRRRAWLRSSTSARSGRRRRSATARLSRWLRAQTSRRSPTSRASWRA